MTLRFVYYIAPEQVACYWDPSPQLAPTHTAACVDVQAVTSCLQR